MSALRRYALEGSALDVGDTGSVTSLELPKPKHERVRRRSELARSRPPDSPPALELGPGAIELPVLSLGEHPGSRIAFHKDAKARDRDADVEMIAPSLPASGTPSVVEVAESDADAASVAPLGAAGAVQQRRVWINFITLCGAIFMNGWNDGTTGPLLPRIQEFYHVSAPSDG